MSRYIDSPNFVMPAMDMDPPSLTVEEEQEIAEQYATEESDLRQGIMDALTAYRGDMLVLSDVRTIAIEAVDAWIAARTRR